MKITNNPGLSQCWVDACQRQEGSHEHKGLMSMTELLLPPQIYQLRKRHDNELTQDVSGMIWSLFGSAVHYILQQASRPGTMTEQRFNAKVLDEDISFCPDRVEPLSLDEMIPYYQNGQFKAGTQLWRLKDFKITKVYSVISFMKQPKFEWHWQVNGYAWALTQIGYPVVEACVEAAMKDYSRIERLKNPREYPEYEVVSLPVRLERPEVVQEFLESKVRGHLCAWDLEDEDLPACSIEERWGKPDLWAVKKIGSDKALPRSTFDSPSEANRCLEARKDKAECEVEYRKSISRRCEEYCACKSVCMQYAGTVNPAF